MRAVLVNVDRGFHETLFTQAAARDSGDLEKRPPASRVPREVGRPPATGSLGLASRPSVGRLDRREVVEASAGSRSPVAVYCALPGASP